MISGTARENFLSLREATVFWALVFSLGILALWAAVGGAAPAAFFLLILGFSFITTFLFPQAGILALVVNTVLFERYFTQAPLIWGDTLIKIYPLDAILGGALAFLVATLIVRRGSVWQRQASDKWLFFFFGYVTVLLLAASFGGGLSDSAVAFSTWKNYVFYGCFYFAVREIFSGASGQRLLAKTFLLSVGAALLFLAIGIVRGEGLWTEFTPLSTSGIRILAFPHALYFSIAFLSLLLLSVSTPGIFGRYRKFFTLIFPVLLLVGIIGSLMRHLWVALLVGMGTGFILLPSEAKGKFMRSTGVLLGIIAVIGMLGIALLTLVPLSRMAHQAFGAVSSIVERAVSISDSGIDESVAWRGSVWQSALQSLSKNPLLGTGLGQNVPVELGDYRAFVELRNIHNSWLALVVQTGLVGTVLFLLFLVSLGKRLFQKRATSREESGVRAAYGSLLIFFSVAFLFQPYLESNILATFFWILLGLIGSFVQTKTSHEDH